MVGAPFSEVKLKWALPRSKSRYCEFHPEGTTNCDIHSRTTDSKNRESQTLTQLAYTMATCSTFCGSCKYEFAAIIYYNSSSSTFIHAN